MPSIVFVPADLEPAEDRADARSTAARWSVSTAPTTTSTGCARELSETDEFETTGFVNVNVRPYYAEGSKTLGYEVAEQLGWRLPGQYVAPMASGSMLTKIHKAFKELVGRRPGAAVVVEGVRRAVGRLLADRHRVRRTAADVVMPVKPTGIAKSLNIGNPADGPYALDAVRGDRRRDGRGDRRRDPRRASGCWPAPPACSPRPRAA